MKRYWFRLHDLATDAIVGDAQWFSTADAREAVIRQSMSDGQYRIERFEGDSTSVAEQPISKNSSPR